MGVIRDAARGAVAGAAGTLAMDLVWYSRYRRAGGTQGFWAWETAAGLDGYGMAPAPAQVGRKAYLAITASEPPARSARVVTNLVHWSTGIGWAKVYGLLQPHSPRPALTAATFGPAVWGTSYVVMPLLGVYKPIWKYDARTLWQDFSAHLVYGGATAAVFQVSS